MAANLRNLVRGAVDLVLHRQKRLLHRPNGVGVDRVSMLASIVELFFGCQLHKICTHKTKKRTRTAYSMNQAADTSSNPDLQDWLVEINSSCTDEETKPLCALVKVQRLGHCAPMVVVDTQRQGKVGVCACVFWSLDAFTRTAAAVLKPTGPLGTWDSCIVLRNEQTQITNDNSANAQMQMHKFKCTNSNAQIMQMHKSKIHKCKCTKVAKREC